ncbi:MAG: hypothetical protein Q9226_009178, partial [Calogaya cf. arnoldii]
PDVVEFVLQRALDDRKKWNEARRAELRRKQLAEAKAVSQDNDDDQSEDETDSSSEEDSTDDDRDDPENWGWWKELTPLQKKNHMEKMDRFEKELKELTARRAFEAIDWVPSKFEDCQNCKERFDYAWNDYDSCAYHPGSLEPDYDNWWPKKWNRNNHRGTIHRLEPTIYDALEKDRDRHGDSFKWTCCRKDEYNEPDGCKMGKHIGPNDDPNSAQQKRRKRW